MKPSITKHYIMIRGKEVSIWKSIAGLLLILIAILAIFWFFNNFERVPKANYKLTERAIYNPYYAAELLINQQKNAQADDEKINIEPSDELSSSDSEMTDATDASNVPYATTLLDSDIKSLLDDLPHIDESMLQSGHRPVLIINSMAAKLSQERFDALQTWVENGGHLITFTGMGVNSKELEELREYINTLQASNATPETYQNDDMLDELIDNLSVGNQFLARLGIMAVNQSFDCEEEDCANESYELQDDAMLEALRKLEEEYGIVIDPETGKIKAKDDSKDSNEQASEARRFQNYLESLRSNRKLAVVTVPDSATNSMGMPLLLKKPISEAVIYTDLFTLKYPEVDNDIQTTLHASYQQTKYQADVIRQYLRRELKRFEQMISHAEAKTVPVGTQGVIKPLDYNDERFKRFVQLILSLEDDDLLSLFAPASDAYLDVPFGEGRISVLLDRDNFTNPDPNLDIYEVADENEPWSSNRTSIKLSKWTPLIELAGYNYRFNLAAVDNANLLLELTKNTNDIWILPDTDIEPLAVMLWKQAKFAILGLMLLLVFWLWSLYDRFGKDKSLSQQKSHDILRYFHQVGRYGWDKDKAVTLLHLSRQQAKLILYEHLPGLVIGHTFSTDISFHTLPALHAKNPNANPLARLSDKDLGLLSRLLIQEYHTKYKKGYADASDPLLIELENQVSYLDDKDTNRKIDAQTLLSPEQLSQALIEPIPETYSAQMFLQITQTLWLLNWILK